jgi:hypothetical protein
MRSRPRVLLALAVAAAAVVAFLLLRGGDDGGTEVTHAELVERANAICAELGEANGALEAPPVPYDTQAEPFFSGVGDNVAAAEEQLGELDPPADDQAELERLVGLYDSAGIEIEQLQAAAAVDQGQEIVTVIDEVARLTEQMAESERALGICPGESSARVTIAAQLRRSRPNPLTETGSLDG